MNPSPIDSEILLGQLVVQQGLAKPEQVQECLNLLRQMAEPRPRLADLLAQKGYLDLRKFDRTLEISEGSAASAPAQPVPEGERFGKYVRTRKLGEGGMGEVWKAWDCELGRWVALKILKGSDAKEIARFRKEAQTAAGLDHPNITTIFEAGENYIAMQYVEGKTLDSVPRNDFKRIASLLRTAALAVHYAHEHHVIHRDIKPMNIMMDRDGRVFVMDFGLAKATSVDSSVSVSGSIVGTPSYMSPEQAKGTAVDARTDVYSLGATLYDLLGERPPFRDSNVYEVLKKVVEDEPIPLSKTHPWIDRDLETITMKCLEKDPARRYTTAREFAEDLGRYLAGDLIQARPVSRSERLRRTLRRHRAVVIPTVAAILLAVLFSMWLGWSSWKKSSRIRSDLREAARWENEAGTSEERREKLLRARGLLSGVLELDPDHPEGRAAFARVDGALRALIVEEDAKVSRQVKERQVATVLGRWARLQEPLAQLERIATDSRKTEEDRRREATRAWEPVEHFLERERTEPAACAAALALAGWARRWAGYPAEGEHWIREATALDPEIPYGTFVEALSLIDSTNGALGACLGRFGSRDIWADQSEEGFLSAIHALRAIVDGNGAVAEK